MEPVKIESWADIRTLVMMCVGTDKGSWWADKEFGSALWKLKQAGKTAETLAIDVKREVEDCLMWLVTDGLASEITCKTTVTGKNTIEWETLIVCPSGNSQIIKDVWNAV